ncbi:hypothetical protein WJX84_006386 [Apatococcus fuscideae]|uniref:Fibronectin type-III domain-containing protein n=1 Tax=Apatococcus fuscideae TaxID=2026836 RepID=A0AAW1SN50_9CHLO
MQLLGTADATSAPEEDKWSCCYRGSALRTQVKGLRPGRSYAFRLQTLPIISPPWVAPPEPQEPSAPVTCATPATVPSPPHAPTVSARDRRLLSFKWRPPDEPGGPAVSAYRFQMSPPPAADGELILDEGFAEVYMGRDTRCKVPRLTAGTMYMVRVKAVNTIGESDWSELTECVTAASVPSQPEAPDITSTTTTSAILGWPAPCDNGAPILHYQAKCDDGAEGDFSLVYTGPETGLEAEGLESGLTYRFRVTAFNAAGRSVVGQPAYVRTAAQAPGAPSHVRALGSNLTSATIVWAGPEQDGGSPLTHYAVQLQPKSAAAVANGLPLEWVVVYQGRSAACTPGGLRAGCTYRVRVCAYNAAGEGPYSVPVDISTAPDVASQPSAPHATQRWQQALQLAWRPPQHDGGSPIHAYRLEGCRVGAVEVAGACQRSSASKGKQAVQPLYAPIHLPDAALACTATVQGLECGTEYLFRVHALNRIGASPVSEPGKAQTQPSAPTKPNPPEPMGVPGSANIRLSWDEPYHNGACICSYTLEQAVPSSHPLQAAASIQQQGLENGDAESACASSSAASDSPDVPQCSSQSSSDLHSGNSRAPTRMPGSSTHKSQGLLAYQGLDRQCEVKGLEPATDYSFRVRACNAAGQSPWSDSCVIRSAAAAPSCPLHLVAEGASCEAVNLHWQEPERAHGLPLTGYGIEYCSQSRARAGQLWHAAAAAPASLTHCQVCGLRSGRAYSFRVRASNERGHSDWSEAVPAATLPAAPAAPAMPTFAQRTASSVRVRWERPSEDNGAAVTAFRLEQKNAAESWHQVYSGSNSAQRVTELAPGQLYSFRVSACNAVGCGPWSESGSVSTQLQPPYPPTSVSAQIQASSSDRQTASVQWEPASLSPDTAECATQEIECISCSEPSQNIKLTCSGKATKCSLPGLSSGGSYQVRVRCVGAAGTGHGAWSHSASFETPGTRELASLPSDGIEALSGPGMPRNRRSGRDLHQLEGDDAPPGSKALRVKRADSRSLSVKSASAKGPSKYRNTWLGKMGVPPKTQRCMNEAYHRYHVKLWAYCLLAVIIICLVVRMAPDPRRRK